MCGVQKIEQWYCGSQVSGEQWTMAIKTPIAHLLHTGWLPSGWLRHLSGQLVGQVAPSTFSVIAIKHTWLNDETFIPEASIIWSWWWGKWSLEKRWIAKTGLSWLRPRVDSDLKMSGFGAFGWNLKMSGFGASSGRTGNSGRQSAGTKVGTLL